MKKIITVSTIVIFVIIYFSLTLIVFPPKYLEQPTVIPQPTLHIELDKNKINLGESFEIKILSQNIGDPGDVLIVSASFPNLEKIKDDVKITGYDFTQSPRYIEVGDEMGSDYTGGEKIISAKYPSIEAYSRPVDRYSEYSMILDITPKIPGTFTIYAKGIILPHTDELSHFPYEGSLDHQNEYVEVYSVEVVSP